MPGTVHVFNLLSEPIRTLSVNGNPVGNIAGHATGTTGTPIYTPASLAVPRVQRFDSRAGFVSGVNMLLIQWAARRAESPVRIPFPQADKVREEDSLIVLLTLNNTLLLTSQGQLLETSPIA